MPSVLPFVISLTLEWDALRNNLQFQKILADLKPLETACHHAVDSTNQTKNGLWAGRLQKFASTLQRFNSSTLQLFNAFYAVFFDFVRSES